MHIELEPYTHLKLLRIVSKDLQPWSNLENDFTCCSPCERKPGSVLTNQHIEPSSRQDTFFNQKVCLTAALLMSTDNICFHREIRKYIYLIPPLIWSYDRNRICTFIFISLSQTFPFQSYSFTSPDKDFFSTKNYENFLISAQKHTGM